MIGSRRSYPDFLDSFSIPRPKNRFQPNQRTAKLSMFSGPVRKIINRSACISIPLAVAFMWLSFSLIINDKPKNRRYCDGKYSHVHCERSTGAPSLFKTRMDVLKGRMGDQLRYKGANSSFPSSQGTPRRDNDTVYPKDMLDLDNLFLDHNRAACRILSVYHVVVIIPTTPENYYRRMVVRATWGNQKYLEDNPFTFSFLFAVGLPPTDEAADVIEVEQRWYQDIVVGNFVDTYYNLTLKMLTAFAWVDKFCPDAMFVIKADDDSYVNMDIVSSILAEVDQKNAYGGRCQTNSTPVRNPQDKFYVTELEYPGDKYPIFCEGPLYFMSSDVARKISRLCFDYPYLKLEDVFMGACMVKNLNVTVFDLPHKVMPYTFNNPRRVPRKAICVHKVSSGVLTQIYRKVHLHLQPKNFLPPSSANISTYLQDPNKDWLKTGVNSEIVKFGTANKTMIMGPRSKVDNRLQTLKRLKKMLRKKRSRKRS